MNKGGIHGELRYFQKVLKIRSKSYKELRQEVRKKIQDEST